MMEVLEMSITITTIVLAAASAAVDDPNIIQIQALLTKAQLYTAGISVGLGGFMAMVAGIMRQIGMREESIKRWKDVFWGTAMVLTGPALVFLLATTIKLFLPGGTFT
jgi:hypothetical protein